MGLYPVAVCYNAIKDNRVPSGQYNTIQYNTITPSHRIKHIQQNNIQHSRQGCYAACVGSWLPTLWDNLSAASSSVKQFKKTDCFLPTFQDNIHLVTSQKIECLCLRTVDVPAKFRTVHLPNTSITAWAKFAMMETVHERVLKFDVHGSVHHNINLIEITNKMRPFSTIYYSNVSYLLNMFRATRRSSSVAQKLQLPPPVLRTFCGCRQLSWLSHDSCRQPQTYVKSEAAITVCELLMMSGVSLETCWSINKTLE
jgi:hypothetical protein